MKIASIAIALLTFTYSAAAQEFDVFDLSDFVDPRLHGATYDENGQITDKGPTFSILNITTGGISNYAWRNRPTTGDIGFVHLSRSTYHGAHQRNLKLTFLGSGRDDELPIVRAMAQIASYQMSAPDISSRKAGIDDLIAGRWLLSALIEKFGSDAPRSWDAELGASIDVITPPIFGYSVAGSLIYFSRKTDEGWVHRGGYVYRFFNRTLFDKIEVSSAAIAGVEKSDTFHWATMRVSTRSSIDLGTLGTLSVVWTPTYLPIEKSRKLHHEVGIFIDRTIKVWMPPR